MLCQNETGVLSGSELYFNTVGAVTRRLFYYINSCGHYYCEAGYKVRRGQVDSLLLMLIEKGSMRVDYRGQKYTALPGDLVLLDCAYPQYYDTAGYVEFYWMHFAGVNSTELCEHLTHARGGVVHRTPNSARAAALLRSLVSQFATGQTAGDAEHSRALHGILCDLTPGARAAAAEETGPVPQAVKFIRGHLGEELSLRRIAGEVHLSPPHLIRLFRAELRHSPHEYIILLRMDRAKYLLKTTSMPVKAIADEVGYRSESSFTSAFTERIGVPPRKFRALPLG